MYKKLLRIDLGNGEDEGLQLFQVLRPVFRQLDHISQGVAELQVLLGICRQQPHIATGPEV